MTRTSYIVHSVEGALCFLAATAFFYEMVSANYTAFWLRIKKRRQDEKLEKKKRELEKSNNFLQHILKLGWLTL